MCTLNFGPRGSSVVTIPRERLEAGVEYTFNLTVWKAGRKEEVASQTVGAALCPPAGAGITAVCLRSKFPCFSASWGFVFIHITF